MVRMARLRTRKDWGRDLKGGRLKAAIEEGPKAFNADQAKSLMAGLDKLGEAGKLHEEPASHGSYGSTHWEPHMADDAAAVGHDEVTKFNDAMRLSGFTPGGKADRDFKSGHERVAVAGQKSRAYHLQQAANLKAAATNIHDITHPTAKGMYEAHMSLAQTATRSSDVSRIRQRSDTMAEAKTYPWQKVGQRADDNGQETKKGEFHLFTKKTGADDDSDKGDDDACAKCGEAKDDDMHKRSYPWQNVSQRASDDEKDDGDGDDDAMKSEHKFKGSNLKKCDGCGKSVNAQVHKPSWPPNRRKDDLEAIREELQENMSQALSFREAQHVFTAAADGTCVACAGPSDAPTHSES